jgi:sulfite exporter TauE/SafE
VKPNKEQFVEGILGILAGAFGTALWWFASFASMAFATSGALFVALSYLWLVLIFAALVWVWHLAEKRITRNIVMITGCLIFLLNTSCWLGFRFGWFRIGG